MTLVIEDGTIVADANSYVDVTELRDYADLRAITSLPVADADCEPLLIKAMDYLESLRARYKGSKTDPTQSLQWPRQDVYIDNILLDANTIPRELKYAQMQLAVEAVAADVQPTIDPTAKGARIEERVEGAVTVRYAESKVAQFYSPVYQKVDALLAPLMNRNGLYSIPLVRA